MASHTASELRMAAGVFGEAARSLGLDPAAMGPPLVEAQEPAAQLPAGGYLVPEADNHTAAVARASASGPFDGELGAEPTEPAGVETADAPDAPFDFEREAGAARAA
jgi:hypothetical protein